MSVQVGLPKLPQPAPSPAAPSASSFHGDPAKLWKAAQEFEAMAIGALLQPMFDTVHTKRSPFSGGAGEEAFRPMMVQEMAKKIASSGGFGLASPVYAQMLRMQETLNQ